MNRFPLTDTDRASNAWTRVTNEINHQLSVLTGRLEKPGLEHPETEFIRGQIVAYRKLLSDADKRRPAVAEQPMGASSDY